MIQNEQQMYDVLMMLSIGLHQLEEQGVTLPSAVDEAWIEIADWLERR